MQRRHRLQRSEDFARSRQEGQVYRHPLLMISVVQNECDYNRYGFITGKALGKATARNRVRRHLREAVRSLHPHLKTAHDIVVIARPAIVGQSYWDVYRVLEMLLTKGGLMVEEQV